MNIAVAAAAAVGAAAGARALWSAMWGLPGDDLPRVVTYHKIASFETGGTWVSPARFERQIDRLLGDGWSFIGEDEFLLALDGRRSSSGREVLLTFDDGYESFARRAAPVLRSRSLPALVFLVTGSAGRWNDWEIPIPGRRARHMDWDTVRSLVRDGFDIGSHTVSHRALTRMAGGEAAEELELSRRRIEDETGKSVRSISYPFGKVNEKVARLAESAGYRAGFTLYPPARFPAACSRYALRREGVWVIDGPASISVKLGRGRLFWLEDLKGRAINSLAGIIPLRGRPG